VAGHAQNYQFSAAQNGQSWPADHGGLLDRAPAERLRAFFVWLLPTVCAWSVSWYGKLRSAGDDQRLGPLVLCGLC
jgi:hypothetical protein